MLHGGDAGGDHLKGRIERVDIEVDPPHHQPGDEPQLERHVGRAQLHRDQADMVMGVDKPRQQDLAAGAEDRDPHILRDQRGSRADLGDDPLTVRLSSQRYALLS